MEVTHRPRAVCPPVQQRGKAVITSSQLWVKITQMGTSEKHLAGFIFYSTKISKMQQISLPLKDSILYCCNFKTNSLHNNIFVIWYYGKNALSLFVFSFLHFSSVAAAVQAQTFFLFFFFLNLQVVAVADKDLFPI